MKETSGPLLWHHFHVATQSQTLSVGDQSQDGLSSSVRMLFLCFEGSRPLAGSMRHTLIDIDEVHIGRGENRQVQRFVDGNRRILKLTVPDSWMSTRHARLLVNQDGVTVEDLSSKNGTLIRGQKISVAQLASGDTIELGCTFLSYMNIPNCDVREILKRDIEWDNKVPGMASLLPELRMQARHIEKISNSTASVVVHGESGTGKELVARAIHSLSRRSGPFIAVNCAAIPDTSLESELFGHKRGAFSGAIADKKGLIEASSG
ncbi:MAG: sigma 54-interacting transcriptional regulator, partial [Kofleriaceae bacterium]|nr:sigma 54-interacting transcriptional regulator [Kofleriaceae bacterium]